MKNMSPEQLHALAEAAKSLDDWRATVDDRDERIHSAYLSGMSKTEIAERMGLSRNTVLAVLGSDESTEGD